MSQKYERARYYMKFQTYEHNFQLYILWYYVFYSIIKTRQISETDIILVTYAIVNFAKQNKNNDTAIENFDLTFFNKKFIAFKLTNKKK